MKFTLSLEILLVLAAFPVASVHGHGYMFEPPSRNYYAHAIGLDSGSVPGVPMKEYCQHCLNGNSGVCGISQSGKDYDNDWVDSQGNAMPWIAQRTYGKGAVIEIHSHLASNHAGHMELKGCPDGLATTQECLDSHVFEFVEDLAYDMPKDANHPERGYYWGGQQANNVDFSMKFRIPQSLVGERVMFQFNYFTANSCSPPGYTAYFGGDNSQGRKLPDEFWSAGVSACVPPYPQDGSQSGIWPEHFFNCAEVSILGDPEPTMSPAPTRAPIAPVAPPPTSAPVPGSTPAPQMSNPTPGGGGGAACCSQDFKTCASWCSESKEACESCPDGLMAWLPWGPVGGSCLARWETCTSNQSGCCTGQVCRGDQDYMQCQHPAEGGMDPDPNPGADPVTSAPAAQVTPSPTKDGGSEICGTEWSSCYDDHDFCCEGQFCHLSTVALNYAHCHRSPDACLQEWKHCNHNPDGCCGGLSCKGDPSWMMCQK